MAPTALADIMPIGTLTSKSVHPTEGKHVHGMDGMRPLQALSHGDVVLPGIPKFESFEAQRQWQLEHMAAAFRHWSREGYVEGISGHISVRDPEHTDAFWYVPRVDSLIMFALFVIFLPWY
jgi:Class II Aldolase and Adducin N-terminal domain